MAGMELRPEVASVFNVCTGQATSISDLARIIGELAGKNINVTQMPAVLMTISRTDSM